MTNWKDSRRAFRQLLAERNLPSARDALQRAIEEIGQDDRRELAGLYNQLAKLNLQLSDFSAAERAARQAIEAEIQFGPSAVESDRSAAHHVMLADALKQQGRYGEALIAVDQGLRLYAQHVEPNNELMENLKAFRVCLEAERWRESS
jgi:tetratricopeptide (TPR) repeat protein